MIFRSSSLLASLALGLAFFGSKYSSDQTFGVVLVTVGITVVTMAEGLSKMSNSNNDKNTTCTSCDGKGAPLTVEDEGFY